MPQVNKLTFKEAYILIGKKSTLKKSLRFLSFLSGGQTTCRTDFAVPHSGPQCDSWWRHKGMRSLPTAKHVNHFSGKSLTPSFLSCFIRAVGAVCHLQFADLPHWAAFGREPGHSSPLPPTQCGKSCGSSRTGPFCAPDSLPSGKGRISVSTCTWNDRKYAKQHTH